MRRDQRSRRSTNNFLPEEPSAEDPGSVEEPLDAEPLDEEDEIMAALETLNPTRKNVISITKRQAPPGAKIAASITTLSLIALD